MMVEQRPWADIQRRMTRRLSVGGVPVGGGAPITVQSMTNTDTGDHNATLLQIIQLAEVGCEIVRVAVPHSRDLESFRRVCADSPIPIVADIHFDHALAISAIQCGASAVRINPGNIGSMKAVDAIIAAAGTAGVPIRIGVNAGSLSKKYHSKDWPLPEKLVASALEFVDYFESHDFHNIALSTKASSVQTTIAAYRILSKESDCPLHIGVTEAGTIRSGTVKSSIGLGILLAEGIGDTLRVSLTADPREEVRVGWEILTALNIRRRGPEVISCPTCSRCRVDLIGIAEEVERRLGDSPYNLTIAVMGCVVNGPGEASDADIGIAAGDGVGVIFVKGFPVRKVAENLAVEALFEEIERLDSPQSS